MNEVVNLTVSPSQITLTSHVLQPVIVQHLACDVQYCTCRDDIRNPLWAAVCFTRLTSLWGVRSWMNLHIIWRAVRAISKLSFHHCCKASFSLLLSGLEDLSFCPACALFTSHTQFFFKISVKIIHLICTLWSLSSPKYQLRWEMLKWHKGRDFTREKASWSTFRWNTKESKTLNGPQCFWELLFRCSVSSYSYCVHFYCDWPVASMYPWVTTGVPYLRSNRVLNADHGDAGEAGEDVGLVVPVRLSVGGREVSVGEADGP